MVRGNRGIRRVGSGNGAPGRAAEAGSGEKWAVIAGASLVCLNRVVRNKYKSLGGSWPAWNCREISRVTQSEAGLDGNAEKSAVAPHGMNNCTGPVEKGPVLACFSSLSG